MFLSSTTQRVGVGGQPVAVDAAGEFELHALAALGAGDAAN